MNERKVKVTFVGSPFLPIVLKPSHEFYLTFVLISGVWYNKDSAYIEVLNDCKIKKAIFSEDPVFDGKSCHLGWNVFKKDTINCAPASFQLKEGS